MEEHVIPPPGSREQGQGLGGGGGRRAKPTLSCNLCRRRKLRCDRQQPCQTCSSRGLSLACSYTHNNSGIVRPQVSRPSLQDRIVQLEQLVMNVIQNQNTSHSNTPTPLPTDTHISLPQHNPDELAGPPTSASTPSDSGSLWFSANETRYVGGAHWTAILDGISDLKEDIDHQDHGSQHSHPQLLYGCRPTSKDAILATLPPRPIVDRSISRYFNLLDLAPSAVHSIQFLREYEKFWMAPIEAPIVWIGLLFSMLCLSSLAEETADTWAGEEYSPLIDTYRERIVQCLIIGEYTNQGPHVMETLYHYLTIEFSVRKDADKDIWLLLGTIVNLAMKMGYHRDSSHFPGISSFVGEMRRRTWATLLQGDILISTQMGMPRLVKEWQCDVSEPRNLNDADFDENTEVLPPSRPETEMTTTLHIIARKRVLRAVGAAVDLTAAVVPFPYSEVMRVDRMLQAAKDSIPFPLRMKPLHLSVTDPPQVIMHRLFISVMFHKGTIILHHKYLNKRQAEGNDEAFAYSRNACLDASLQLIDMQQIFDEETRLGGLLHSVRWRISSFLHHEFLTATIILCWIFHHGVDKIWPDHSLDIKDQITTALRKSHNIWSRLSNSSRDARKASETLTLLFNSQSGHITSLSSTQPETFNLSSNMDLDNMNSLNTIAQLQDDNLLSAELESFSPYQIGLTSFWDMNFIGQWEGSEETAHSNPKMPSQVSAAQEQDDV
ncbi:hypothetical protein F4678DRAFT_479829 [Xylaria arbuscula]|nr:hypothetical protein F4678DRAFT_479829 [Xylaria arbuscula]